MVNGFKTIMLPVDFSDHCDHAAEYAAWLAGVSQGTIHLVHVVSNPADPRYEPEEAPYWDMVEHSEKKAREMVQLMAERCVPAPLLRECHVLQGDPYEKLMEAAQQIQPDLIVMSSHGHGRVAHLVIGSVAEKIVRHATCPVLVVHTKHV